MRGRRGKRRRVREGAVVDKFSNLPDPILSAIISLIPAKEAVGTSILSKRWISLWKHTSDLSFDQKEMSKAAIQNYLESTELSKRLEKAQRRARPARDATVTLRRSQRRTRRNEPNADPISAAARSINSVLDAHCGALKSCRIQHLVESCGEAVGWMTKLLDKEVSDVSMERDAPEIAPWQALDYALKQFAMTLDLPFSILSGFRVLELKNYQLKTSPPYEGPQNLQTLRLSNIVLKSDDFEKIIENCLSLENLTLIECRIFRRLKIHNRSLKILNLLRIAAREIDISARNLEIIELDSVACEANSLVISAPNLKVLHCRTDFNHRRGELYYGNGSLGQTRDILQILNGGKAENLLSLYTDLNLRIAKDVMALSMILTSCYRLENLDINYQVDDDTAKEFYKLNENNSDPLGYPSSMFWRTREFSECVILHLKTVNITGYKGKVLELEFVKYLITTAEVMESITIWFDDECAWEDATSTMCLLAYPRTSPNLSITLKPGKHYLENVGGSFQRWMPTLKSELALG